MQPIEILQENQNMNPLKKMMGNAMRQHNNNITHRSLRDNTRTRCLSTGTHYPLLTKRGTFYTNYISWLIGSAETAAEIPEDFLETKDDRCRLCGRDPETRQHLLSECPETIDLRDTFIRKLADGHPDKYNEYLSIAPQDRWLWIIAGGTHPLPQPQPEHRTQPRTTAIELGETINIPKDEHNKSGLDECLIAFQQYLQLQQDTQEIRSKYESPDREFFQIFTDGSHRRSPGLSGAAASIYQNKRLVHTVSSHTGPTTNNYAELHAVLLALRYFWEQEHRAPILSIFTDSTYVQDRLTDPMNPRQNFYIIQEILHLATRLQQQRQASLVVHKIPAHLGARSLGLYNIPENTNVDHEAKRARNNPRPFLSAPQTRQQTLHLCAWLLMGISNQLDPPDDGPSSDRLSLSACANRDSDTPEPEIHLSLA